MRPPGSRRSLRCRSRCSTIRGWAGPDPELLSRLGIGEEQLPGLRRPTSRPEDSLAVVAEATGSRRGFPFHRRSTISTRPRWASGVVCEGDLSLGTGTAWAMIANSGRLGIPVTPHAIVCPHPVRGLYGQLLSMVNGGSAIEWAARLTGTPLSPQEVEAAMGGRCAASDGLLFWPHLAGLSGSQAARNWWAPRRNHLCPRSEPPSCGPPLRVWLASWPGTCRC